MASGIYRIDGPNGKVYIGSSANIKARWYTHRYQLERGVHGNKHLQSAWNKHGADAFTFSILELVDDKNELARIEQAWLDILFTCLDSGDVFNAARYADCAFRGVSRKGKKVSLATKEKISIAHRELWRLPEERSGKTHVFRDRFGREWIIDYELCDFANEENITLQDLSRLIRGELFRCNGGWEYAGYYHEIITDQGWVEEFVDFWDEMYGVYC